MGKFCRFVLTVKPLRPPPPWFLRVSSVGFLWCTVLGAGARASGARLRLRAAGPLRGAEEAAGGGMAEGRGPEHLGCGVFVCQ